MSVVGAREAPTTVATAVASPGKLGEAVREVAERGTTRHRDQAERCNGDARAGA